MIVTVVPMRMMEAAVDDVIDMIPVRHGFVAASRPVHVPVFLASGEPVLAAVRVSLADGDDVLVVVDQSVDLVRMVQMAVVQIVDMVVVAHRLVTATGAVAMLVIGMGMTVLAHR
jgi:hypothetical protein